MIEGKKESAQAGRTDVRVEALRAAIPSGTAEAVPLTWTRAAIVSTSHPFASSVTEHQAAEPRFGASPHVFLSRV